MESAMLVLSRRPNECIRIGNNITIKVLRIDRDRVRLGFDAPMDIPILRAELQSPSTDDVDATNVNRNAITDWESEGGGALSTHAAA